MLEHSIIIIQNCTIMKLNEFIENFANQFDDTDVSEITAATEFKALDEWSSLVALSIIAMVDEDMTLPLRVTIFATQRPLKTCLM